MNNFKVINTNTIIRDLEEENKKLKDKVEDDKELIQSLYDYP